MKHLLFLAFFLILAACHNLQETISDPIIDPKYQNVERLPVTRSVPTVYFDWEHADWMPTPPGQSRITVPWIGQGALSCGLDVINDHKSEHGWELLYSSFDPDASSPLQNPYFILYNKYRGIMRIFLYLTTQFVATSTYIEDCLAIEGNNTSLLNFMGDDMVDASQYKKAYTQLQPKVDGDFPLATNKWYMMQYELAYDPNIAQMPYDEINIKWLLRYYDVQNVDLGGEQKGAINGTIGTSTSGSDSHLIDLFQKSGTGVLAAVGKDFFEKHTIDGKTGQNSLWLPNAVFKDISAGVSKALTSTVADFPSTVIKFLSGIFGGTGTMAIPVNLTIKTKIQLTGSITSGGLFPSSPTSLWMPGTDISAEAYGYVPFYNKSLGVFNLTVKPMLELHCETREQWESDDPFDPGQIIRVDYITLYMPKSIDYSNYLIINPEVLQIADVSIEKQDLVVVEDQKKIVVNPVQDYGAIHGSTFFDQDFPEMEFGVRFTLKVTPKDGSPASILIKTFLLNDHWNHTYIPGEQP